MSVNLVCRFPETTSVYAVNRQCSSGLQAVAAIAASIRAGFIDVGIGAGVECMTKHYGPQSMPSELSKTVLTNAGAKACLVSMGETSENVAEKFGISRQDQDAFAVASHKKAAAAQEAGAFVSEIAIVHGVERDEGIRRDASLEGLAELKPSFRPEGSTTPGNASQISDGAAAVLLMRRSKARELGLKARARFVSFAVAGCHPEIMGIGPVYAIPRALELAHVAISDLSVIELNEAFASQALYCIRTLNLPPERVNMRGGAIALGHPLGATGARQIATILSIFDELANHDSQNKKPLFGLVSMCIGTGMGAAAVLQSEPPSK